MLPKVKVPLFDVVIPSTKKSIKVRQFTVKEEKILLMANQSGEVQDFFNSILQIVSNCIMDSKINVKKLPLFDIEYIFTKIRAVSVSNISKVSYGNREENSFYDFEINLDTLEVVFPEDISTTFKVNNELSFTLKYPPMEMYTNKEFFEVNEEGVLDMMFTKCLDKVFEGEKVYEASEQSEEEIKEFLNSLPAKTFDGLRKFFTNLPSMKHEISYTNKSGEKVNITLKTLSDFFTFG